MVNFKKLGFETFENYFDYFLQTLLISNKTYEYFVDWYKVKKHISRYLNEISLLNSLTKIQNNQREKYLKKLINSYPKIRKVIPMLIAERLRNNNIDIFDPDSENLITIDLDKIDDENNNKIVNLCKNIGIINLFDEIKDLYDYLLGIEVGLDSNARKNRSGKIFEKMVHNKIIKVLGNKYNIVTNDKAFSLYTHIDKNKGKGKTHDVVIYDNNKPVLIIECSFYNVSGSKPISIAESYPELSKLAKEFKIDFLWVTDGPAWLRMKETLMRSMYKIDWILNFKMLDLIKKILN